MADTTTPGTAPHSGRAWTTDTIVAVVSLVLSVCVAGYNAYDAYTRSQSAQISAQHGAYYLGALYAELENELHVDPALTASITAADDYLHGELRKHEPFFHAANLSIDPDAYSEGDIDSDLPSNGRHLETLDRIIVHTLAQTTDDETQASFNFARDMDALQIAASRSDFPELYGRSRDTVNDEFGVIRHYAKNCKPLPALTDAKKEIAAVQTLELCVEKALSIE